MKYARFVAALGVFLILSPAGLFADCPTITSHACCGGGFTWKAYTFDRACGWASAGVTNGSACSLTTHRTAPPTATTQSVTYYYTIPQTSTGWEARLDYDFNNGGNVSNFILASYTVSRNFSVVDSGNIINTTSSASCTFGSVSGRSWNAGDLLTVTVSFRATTAGSHAEVSNLVLFKVPA